jgi:hypothetical protein
MDAEQKIALLNSKERAFPCPATNVGGDYECGQEGMTLRDWYIGKALEGLCANPNLIKHLMAEDGDVPYGPDDLARAAVVQANFVMEAKDKP